MVKQLLFATRIPGHHVQPVGRPCGTWVHYAMRDVKDMGQQIGYRSLEWDWPKEAMNIPIWAGIVEEPSCSDFLVIVHIINHIYIIFA